MIVDNGGSEDRGASTGAFDISVSSNDGVTGSFGVKDGLWRREGPCTSNLV